MADQGPHAEDPGDRSPRQTAPGESVGPARPIDRGADASRPPAPDPPSGASPAGEGGGQPVPTVEAAQAPTTVQRAADASRRPEPPQRGRRQRSPAALSAVDKVRRTSFPVVMRGYDRAAVDAYVAEVAQLVAELEATQLPETVVQRALDQVGEETSTILKHAHEAAEEITSRARTQAEARLHEARTEAQDRRHEPRAEAEGAQREAEVHARRLEEDNQEVWDERRRLIEDIRHLADDVLALADDALDRIPPPAGATEEPTTAAVDETDEQDPELPPPTADTVAEDEDTADRGPAGGGFPAG